jgi:hypothetical protein
MSPSSEFMMTPQVWEVVDNAIDEVQAGFATSVDVELLADGSVSITDNGRGVRSTPGVSLFRDMPTDCQATSGSWYRGGQTGKRQLFRWGRCPRRGGASSDLFESPYSIVAA